MSYAAAVQHLYALGQELAPADSTLPRRKFDLEHMRVLAHALGDPQKSYRCILIAGTNGKGSTAATLASILASAGYETGLYTSPHLESVTERIQVSAGDLPGEYASAEVPSSSGPGHLVPIREEDFGRLYFLVDTAARKLMAEGALAQNPSFFEILTGVAFLYFAERHVDTAVLEVGLGVRLDATNIVDPLLSVLTDISLDHQEYLGSTLAEITREKAGILRPHGVLITLPQHPEVNQTIGEVAAETPGLRAISAADFVPAPRQRGRVPEADSPLGRAGNKYEISVDGSPLVVDSSLVGAHQQRNLALAIAAAKELGNNQGYNISGSQISEGIRRTSWPGRLEFLPPNVLLDVAHNPAGAWALRSALATLPETQPRTLLFSCLRDKDLPAMAQILFPLFDASAADRSGDHIILTPLENPRSSSLDDLVQVAHSLGVLAHASPHVAAASAQAKEVTPSGGLIVGTGSVYLVGDLRRLVRADG